MNFLVKFFTAAFEAALHVFLSLDEEKIIKIRKNYTSWYKAGKVERAERRRYRKEQRAIRRKLRQAKRKARRIKRKLDKAKKRSIKWQTTTEKK